MTGRMPNKSDKPDKLDDKMGHVTSVVATIASPEIRMDRFSYLVMTHDFALSW